MAAYHLKRPTKMVLFVFFGLLLLVNSAAAIRSLLSAAVADDPLAKPGASINRKREGEIALAAEEEAESSEALTMDMKDFDEECSDADEECLIRRNLAAHVDYIYTQHHHKP